MSRWPSRPWPPAIRGRCPGRAEAWPYLNSLCPGGGTAGDLECEAALAGGDLRAARRWADDAVVDSDWRVACLGANDARPGGDRAG